MKRIITIAAMTAILSTGAMAQTFFSLSAGNSGVNVNVTNGMGQWPMYYGPVVPYYPSKKAVKKARKRARKAARDYNRAVNFWFPLATPAYYYDDDDVEDYYKHRAKMYKKHQKRAKKAYKHSKKRHKRHDDDD